MALNLDIDVLRTLVTADRLGSFQRAAERVGRSQSAVSQQIRKIEGQIGLPLFRKSGRGLVPTDSGDLILAYARRILALNDEAVAALKGRRLAGAVRFGLPSDLAQSWLPGVLAGFARSHPGVAVETVVDRNRKLLERLDRGELDLVLALGQGRRTDAEALAQLPLRWIGPADWSHETGTLALAAVESPCFFRQRMVSALELAGRSFRFAFTTASLDGLWPAVAAGLGVTLRLGGVALPNTLRVIEADLPLPAASSLELCLHRRAEDWTAPAERLREVLCEAAAEHLPA
jgi:DNA-binding transcriptional LysR family regulator